MNQITVLPEGGRSLIHDGLWCQYDIQFTGEFQDAVLVANGRVVGRGTFKIKDDGTKLAWTEAAGRVAKYLAKGALGAVKAKLGIGTAEEEVIKSRLQICAQCPHISPCTHNKNESCCGRMLDRIKALAKGDPNAGRRPCGCMLKLKTKAASEACPIGKW